MKLYYAPGACSMAVHIVLREAGYAFDLEPVDLATGMLSDGRGYAAVNPKGYVPALALDNGQVLTEVAAILQYLADPRPDLKLSILPPDLAHFRLLEWLNFISTEVHKTLGALFNPQLPAACRAVPIALLRRRCDWLASALGAGPFLMGAQYTIADAYLFTVLNWTAPLDIDLSPWPALQDYLGRVAARPAVQETLKAEGLAG
jgi:glutathione S-transferase